VRNPVAAVRAAAGLEGEALWACASAANFHSTDLGGQRSRGFSSTVAPASPATGAAAAPPLISGVSEAAENEDLTPFCLDLRGLNERLRRELPAKPQRGAPIDQDVVDRVSEMLRHTKLNPREWKQHAIFRRGRYTRNIVGYAPGQYIALLLCWERGQQSPIHDHSGAHCFVKMLTGKLKEEQFSWAPGRQAADPIVVDEAILDAGVEANSVAFAHDDKGLHRVSNPDGEEVAVSLHIYSPPFEDCLVFPPTGGAARRAPMVSINARCLNTTEVPTARPTGVPPPPSISDLCTSLTRIAGELGWQPPTEVGASPSPTPADPFGILDLMGSVELSPMEWAKLAGPAHFSEFHCTQNLVHCDQHFSVIVSCWSPGQSIPPHHVGTDRREWVKVVSGSLKYQEFSPGLFWSDVDRESDLPEGSSTVLREGSARTRAVTNASETTSAVSIHIFSPPLTQFTFRTEKGIERKCVPMLAGALGELSASDSGTVSEAATAAEAAEVAGAAATAEQWAAAAAKGPGDSAAARSLLRESGRRYLSFRALMKLLDQELARPDCRDDVVTALLRKAVFHPEEWRSHVDAAHVADGNKPRRVVLAERPDYSMTLSFWGQHMRETAAPRGSDGRTWTLILEGELEERAFGARDEKHGALHNSGRNGVLNGGVNGSHAERRLLRVSTLKEDSVSFTAGEDEVQLCCDSDAPCVALQLHCPAQLDE